jgi:hypothetical protein
LVEYSEDFSGYTKFASSVTTDQIADPNGNTTADLITADGTSNRHGIRVEEIIESLPEIPSGTSSTISCHFKANTNDLVQIMVDSGVQYWANFDIANGSVGSKGNNTTASIEGVGNGWFRVSLSSSDVLPSIRIVLIENLTDGRYPSNTLSTSLYIWGLQVEVGSSVGTYVKTEGLPYYGGGATQNGLLIEEQRVNSVTHSEEFDNAAWIKSGAGGVTITANDILAPDGTITADKMMADAVSGEHYAEDSISFSAGTYTHSVFAKAGEYNYIRLRPVHVGASEGNTSLADYLLTGDGTATLGAGAGTSASIESYGNGWYRCIITFTVTGTLTTTSVRVQMLDNTPTSVFTGNGSDGVYVWGAQHEVGAFATSYIPTSGSTVTRSADLATMSTGSLPFTGYNQSEGTIETKFEFVGYLSVFGSVYKFQNSDHTERIGVLQLNSSNSIYEEIRDSVAGNTIQFSSLNSNVGEIITHLLAYKADDVAVRRAKDISGTVTLTGHEDSSVTIPDTIDRLGFGVRTDTSSVVSSVIFKYFRYYPRRLSNDTLFAIRRG